LRRCGEAGWSGLADRPGNEHRAPKDGIKCAAQAGAGRAVDVAAHGSQAASIFACLASTGCGCCMHTTHLNHFWPAGARGLCTERAWHLAVWARRLVRRGKGTRLPPSSLAALDSDHLAQPHSVHMSGMRCRAPPCCVESLEQSKWMRQLSPCVPVSSTCYHCQLLVHYADAT